MSQIAELTKFIKDNLPARAAEFDSYRDNQTIVVSNKALGLGQQRIGYVQYDAVLQWDIFPFRLCNPGQIYALVLIWLSDHANDLREEYKLPDPEIDSETLDEETANIFITVTLVDPIVIAPTDGGPLPKNGQAWDLVDTEVNYAEEALIYGLEGASGPAASIDDASADN